MKAEKYVFVPDKLNYLRGENRPQVECILCGVRDFNEKVENLVVYQNEVLTISLNLYPYNVGHLLIFPNRHLEKYRDLTDKEMLEIHKFTKKSMDILDKLYQPYGYNIGWNCGSASGASISHIHQHLVPRYKNELGFLDITAHTKVLVEYPEKTLEKIKKEFQRL